MDDLYNLVYGTYNNGGGTQLYNALVRGGIDSLEKFDSADIEYLNTIKGIGGVGRRRIAYLKRLLREQHIKDLVNDIYKRFLDDTEIDPEKVASYNKSHETTLLLAGHGRTLGIKIELKSGSTIRYCFDASEWINFDKKEDV